MRRIVIILTIFASLYPCHAEINGFVRIAAIRVSFIEDDSPGTTGNGSFLLNAPITLADIHYLSPVDFTKWSKTLNMKLHWIVGIYRYM